MRIESGSLWRSDDGSVVLILGVSIMTKKFVLTMLGLVAAAVLVLGPQSSSAEAHGYYGYPRYYGPRVYAPRVYSRPVYGPVYAPPPAYYGPGVIGTGVTIGGPGFSVGIGAPVLAPAPAYYGPVYRPYPRYGRYYGW